MEAEDKKLLIDFLIQYTKDNMLFWWEDSLFDVNSSMNTFKSHYKEYEIIVELTMISEIELVIIVNSMRIMANDDDKRIEIFEKDIRGTKDLVSLIIKNPTIKLSNILEDFISDLKSDNRINNIKKVESE